MKKAVFLITMLMLGGLSAGLVTSCGGKKESEVNVSDTEMEADVMLVDYYTAVSGTDGNDSHKEYVLYTYDETHCRLSVFVRTSPSEPETETVYLVPAEAKDRSFEAIEAADLRSWVDLEDGNAIDGGVTVVKFKDGDGYIRCATDNMPDGGESLLDSVGTVLMGYAKEAYLQKNP